MRHGLDINIPKFNYWKGESMRPKIKANMSFRLKRKSINYSRLQSILKNQIGVWIDGKIFWVKNGKEKLIPEKSISIKINQRSIHSKIKFLDIFVTNHTEKLREIKLIVMHSFDNFAQDDLTFFSPVEKVIYHIGKRAMYLVNGQMNGTLMNDYTIQPVWNVYTEKFWDCRSMGKLKYQPMSHGPSNSLFTLNMKLPASKTHRANTWMITGNSKDELMLLNRAVLKKHTSFSF
jgi:hypothetical protein